MASSASVPATKSELPRDELQRLVEHLPYFAVILDSERRYRWYNRLDSTLEPEQVIGERVESFTPPEYHAVAIEVVERCLREGENGYYEVLGYGEGEYATWYGCRVVAIPADADGKPRALVLSHDISERKRTELALGESEARFRRLVETSPDMIATIDEARRIVYVNHAASSAPIDVNEIRGSDILTFVAEQDRERVGDLINRALHTREPVTYECQGARTRNDFRVQLVPLPSDSLGVGTECALVVATDVTEERRSEVRLLRMMAELDHRVKNTLATIVVMARQTLDRSSSLGDFGESFVGRLESMARAHDALAASQWTEVAVARLVRDALVPYVSEFESVVVSMPKLMLPAPAVAPLAMVLHELVTNAVKHGALAGAVQTLEVRLDLDDVGNLQVDWYERDVPQPPETGPMGFGMVLVRGVVEQQLGGTFQKQVGTTDRRYQISIPVKRGDGA